ncbi:type I-MYXAN CRISPR-associated protein Cas6/Cmx6 [Ferroacidibacillus organovorans]|nr:type I-MYXAN CRISPR-associated protein Cas6/Cmx6 [Ferroacidibacillus organovorans]
MKELSMKQRLFYRFSLYGDRIPIDHGEVLYAAISGICPDLHELDGFSLSPVIRTVAVGNELLLQPGSCFFAQVPETHLAQLVTISGKTLSLRAAAVRVGPMQVQLIQPATTLRSRVVTFKNAVTEDSMLRKVEEALHEMGGVASIKIVRRRILTIHTNKVIGFGVELSGLLEDTSLALQVHGIGGRRRFGCGVFLPGAEVTNA